MVQQLDRRIAIPIAVTGIGGTVMAGISAMAHKADRKVFYLLLAACGVAVVGEPRHHLRQRPNQ